MHAFSMELCASVEAYTRSAGRSGPAGQASPGGVDPGRLARPGQRDERRRRGGVGQQPVEGVGQAERLAEPVDDDLLELGPDRRGPPQHRVLPEPRRQHLAEDPRPDAVVAK
jgi:hypothetical protein